MNRRIVKIKPIAIKSGVKTNLSPTLFPYVVHFMKCLHWLSNNHATQYTTAYQEKKKLFRHLLYSRITRNLKWYIYKVCSYLIENTIYYFQKIGKNVYLTNNCFAPELNVQIVPTCPLAVIELTTTIFLNIVGHLQFNSIFLIL